MNFRGNCKIDAVVYIDNAEVLRLLLDKFQPQDIDQQDAEGENVLIKAIAWGAARCLQLILERNPTLTIINKYGQNILHKLAASAKSEVIGMFAEHSDLTVASLDATAKDRHGRTARDLFDERPGITEDLRDALYRLLWRTTVGPRSMPRKDVVTEKTCLLEKQHDAESDTDKEDEDEFFDALVDLLELG
jgi:ankyrin repeat protein